MSDVKQLTVKKLWARVNATRVAAYNNFIEIKGYNDFYFELLITQFLSLAQYPLNFVVLDDRYRVIFHFCLDKEYRSNFTKYIDIFEKSNGFSSSCSFKLFPNLLNDRYHISIFYMNTRSNLFNKQKRQWEVIDSRDVSNLNEDEGRVIKNKYEYISSCADLFFSDKWGVFDTKFSLYAGKCIAESIKKLEISYMSRNDNFTSREYASTWPNNKGLSAWTSVVNNLLRPYISDSYHGFRMVNSISEDNTPSLSKNNLPPNILIAYRTFSRSIDDNMKHRKYIKLRHNNSNGEYNYDVQFVSPDNKVVNNDNNIVYTNNSLVNNGGYQEFFINMKNKDRKYLYSNIFNYIDERDLSDEFREIFPYARKISEIIDNEFWNLINIGKDGVDKIISILSNPAGDCARSIADPVFHTGLIHFNKLFQFGGMETIFINKIKECINYDDIDLDIREDLMRNVIIYYIMSNSIDCENIYGFNPVNLQAILIPIKIRGSVWGVEIHSLYMSASEEEAFIEDTHWLTKFLFSNSGRIKTRSRIDRLLWEQAQRRVSELLRDGIARAGSISSNHKDAGRNLANEIDIINKKLRGEQMASPYAFPKIDLCLNSNNDNYIVHLVEDDKDGMPNGLYFSWTIVENTFFKAMQEWNRGWTRSFEQAILLGINSGFMVLNFQSSGR